MNCGPPGYTWGSPIVPTRPRGMYRSYWQAADVVGCPRRFPSAAMACAGRIERKDNWDPLEFKFILDHLAGTTAWAASFVPWTQLALTPQQLATNLRAYFHLFGIGNAWGWFNFWDFTAPITQPIITLLYDDVPNVLWHRLTDMASWPALGPAPSLYNCVSHGLVIQGATSFGTPWLNAI